VFVCMSHPLLSPGKARASATVSADYSLTALGRLLSYPVVVADPDLPPSNSVDVLRFVEDAFVTLGCIEFKFVEFCELAPETKATGRVQQLLDLAKDKVKAAQAKAKEKAADEEELKVKAADAAAYTPPSFDALSSSIYTSSTATASVCYWDPIKGVPESIDLAKLRILAQRVLEAVLIHHSHIIKSCVAGDIADMVARLRSLCAGDPAAVAMDLVAELVALSVAPQKPWSALAAQLCQLDIKLRACPADLSLGPGLLAAHALRALSHFPELQVELSLLRKLAGTPTLPVIISTINKAVDANPSLGGSARGGHQAARGYAAYVAPGAKGRSICFAFRDTGRCSRGTACRFSHDPKDIAAAGAPADQVPHGSCYECGSVQHGVHACPLHQERKGAAKLQARLAEQAKAMCVQTQELVALKAAVSHAPPGGPVAVLGMAAMASWGFDDDLRALAGGWL
jgi:hypothetical protein